MHRRGESDKFVVKTNAAHCRKGDIERHGCKRTEEKKREMIKMDGEKRKNTKT